MFLYRSWLAVSVILILAGTAWITADTGANPYFAYSMLALLAFGLDLADGSTMGFVFIILALPHLGWRETLLLAESATFIHAVTHPERVEPRVLLRSLCATALAIVTTQFMFHGTMLAGLAEPLRLMLASGVCFVALHALRWNRSNLWSFPYYPVAGAIAALFPVSVVLAPLLYLTWWSYRLYERRLEEQQKQWKKAASLNLRTIEALALAIEAKDQPMRGHSRRVQIYAVEMAKELGLEPKEIEALRTASLLYDIGELAVPEHIILKPGPLTPEEFEKVKIHPTVAAGILGAGQVSVPSRADRAGASETMGRHWLPEGFEGHGDPDRRAHSLGGRCGGRIRIAAAASGGDRRERGAGAGSGTERKGLRSSRHFGVRRKQKALGEDGGGGAGSRLHRFDFFGAARSERVVRPDAKAGKLARSAGDVRDADAGAATTRADGFVRRLGGTRRTIIGGIYRRRARGAVFVAANSDGPGLVGVGSGEPEADHQRRSVM